MLKLCRVFENKNHIKKDTCVYIDVYIYIQISIYNKVKQKLHYVIQIRVS